MKPESLDRRVGMALSLLWIGYWVGLALSDVHQRIPASAGDKEYGWLLPYSIAALVGLATLFGYMWGRGRRS